MTRRRGKARLTAMSKPHRDPSPAAGAARHYSLADREIEAAKLKAGLHIVATPIGNLGDITLRALATLAGADLIACEDTRVTRRLLERYATGTPLISDPGFKLVRAAHEAGHAVTTLPGASSLLAALAVAGLPTDQFLFAGFLPPKATARRPRIAELGRIPATLVLFETGPRLAATLADLAAGLGPREAA